MNGGRIVRDPEHLGGRWRFEGTAFAVSEVRAAIDADPDLAASTYHRAGLSAEDLRAAQSFEFPEIRQSSMEVQYGSVVVHCPCGEDTPASGTSLELTIVNCVCGRTWRVRFNIAPDVGCDDL